jgi:hypothetical protein
VLTALTEKDVGKTDRFASGVAERGGGGCVSPEIACTPARSKPTPRPAVYPSPFSATDRAREHAGACARDCTPPARQDGRARRLCPRGTIARIEPLGRLLQGALRHRLGLFARPQGHSPQAPIPRAHRSLPEGLEFLPTRCSGGCIQSVQAKRRGDTPSLPLETPMRTRAEEGRAVPTSENECTPARVGRRCFQGSGGRGSPRSRKIASVAPVAPVASVKPRSCRRYRRKI